MSLTQERAGAASEATAGAMRVAAIGTSNTIMRAGWLPFLERLAPKGWSFDNLSVGGSCALFMPGMLELRAVARDYDLCLIELPVNDQRYLDVGFLSPEMFCAALAGIFAPFAEPGARCRPIVLSLPVRSGFTPFGPADRTHRLLSQMAAAYGVALLDIGECLRAACAASPRQATDFFSDGLHLKPAVQRHVAAALLRRISEAPIPVPRDRLALGALAPRFSATPARRLAGERPGPAVEERRTSLCAWDTLRLRTGEAIRVPGRGHCVGLLHWAEAESGEIVLRSAGRASRKSLRKMWKMPIFFFTHLLAPLPVDGALELSVGPDPSIPEEPSINAAREGPAPDGGAEIAYLALADRDPRAAGAALLAAVRQLPERQPATVDERLVSQLPMIPLD